MKDPRKSMIDRRPDFFIVSVIAGLLIFEVVVSVGDPVLNWIVSLVVI